MNTKPNKHTKLIILLLGGLITLRGFFTLLHYDYIFSTPLVVLFWVFYSKSDFEACE
jgi:hypothetical protein